MNNKRILPSRQIDSNACVTCLVAAYMLLRGERDFLMSNKRVTIIECVTVEILENKGRSLAKVINVFMNHIKQS